MTEHPNFARYSSHRFEAISCSFCCTSSQIEQKQNWHYVALLQRLFLGGMGKSDEVGDTSTG